MGTPKRLAGPVALSATMTTNILAGAGGSALLKDIVTHIHVANKTGGAATFSIWLGASAGNVAGTELFSAKNVPANDVYDWYGRLPLLSTDFLVGGASAGATLTIEIEGEQVVI